VTNSQFYRAVIIWTGWGQASRPLRDEGHLVKEFGQMAAADLMPRIRALEYEFYASDARFLAANLEEMGDMVANDFRQQHPEVPEDVIQALTWCYTWDFK
jgi:hypothetical protein